MTPEHSPYAVLDELAGHPRGDDLARVIHTAAFAAADERRTTLEGGLAELFDRAGLYTDAADEHDRRAQRIVITEAGRAALRGHVRDGNRWLARAMDEALTPAEQEIVRVAAGLLLQVAEHDAGDERGSGAAPPL